MYDLQKQRYVKIFKSRHKNPSAVTGLASPTCYFIQQVIYFIISDEKQYCRLH